jgi:xanthine dehydrogenase accessory factor
MSALTAFLAAHPDLILVRVASTKGSAPRESDAWMLVAAVSEFGTIGGGRLEFDALEMARGMLRSGENEKRCNVTLGHEINQCCGGRVDLAFSRVADELRRSLEFDERAALEARPAVLVFGAGHVGRAIARSLAPLPFSVRLIDTRPQVLQPPIDGVAALQTALPEALVREAAPGSAVIVLTHEHATDFLIASEALKRGDLSYVGLIGSKTKKAVFRADFLANGGTLAEFSRLVSPIGANPSGDKRPEVIAAFVAAELCIRLLAAPARAR